MGNKIILAFSFVLISIFSCAELDAQSAYDTSLTKLIRSGFVLQQKDSLSTGEREELGRVYRQLHKMLIDSSKLENLLDKYHKKRDQYLKIKPTYNNKGDLQCVYSNLQLLHNYLKDSKKLTNLNAILIPLNPEDRIKQFYKVYPKNFKQDSTNFVETMSLTKLMHIGNMLQQKDSLSAKEREELHRVYEQLHKKLEEQN